MCGITCIYSKTSDLETRRTRLLAMTRALKHRGPDHQGTWFDADHPLGLGQARLAIVDLSRDGEQPMISASGRYVISYNGEIYNFRALHQELVQLGVTFRGRSDTEVFLAAIDKWGLNAALQKINGMFAIILYDRTQHELHLIRDRLGKKPLYIGWAGDDFVAASELRPFLTHPGFQKQISSEAVSYYLRLGFVPAPWSIFRHVYMLLPGTRVALPVNQISAGTDLRPLMHAYYHPARVVEDAMHQRSAQKSVSFDERCRQTESLIDACVHDRLIADVPLGAFLSGGVDSSLVVALMQKQMGVPVKTFSIGFTEHGYNEAPYAAAIAQHLGTDHHEQILSPRDALDIVPNLPKLCDEPLADASFIPTYLVAKFARDQVTVALTGDGGDELFGGYHRHVQMGKIAMLTAMMPGPIRFLCSSILQGAAPIYGRWARAPQVAERLRKLGTAITYAQLPDLYECLISMAEDNTVTMIPRPNTGYPFRSSDWWPTDLGAMDWARYADTIHYLPNDVLAKVDRATMSVGLEARAPLLDTRLFKHAWGLPSGDLINNGQGKHILRQILARHVPMSFIDRPKQGFSVPIDAWLRGSLKDWAQSFLGMPDLYNLIPIPPEHVKAMWEAHQRGQNGYGQTLWRLVVLGAWAENYGR